MSPRSRRQPDDRAPLPNVLSEGNPVPNVLRGEVRPHSPEPGSQAAPPARRRRRPPRVIGAGAGAAVRGATSRKQDDVPPRRARPGCGCGGWLGLLVLLYLASQLLGSCDQLLAPDAGSVDLGAPGDRVTVDWHDLRAGDCFDWPEDEDGFARLTLVDCAAAHDAEVTGVLDLDDQAGSVSGEAAIGRAAEVACWSVYSAYTGEPALIAEGSDPEVLYPGADTGWRAGDRTVICLAAGDGTAPLAGSVRAAGAR